MRAAAYPRPHGVAASRPRGLAATPRGFAGFALPAPRSAPASGPPAPVSTPRRSRPQPRAESARPTSTYPPRPPVSGLRHGAPTAPPRCDLPKGWRTREADRGWPWPLAPVPRLHYAWGASRWRAKRKESVRPLFVDKKCYFVSVFASTAVAARRKYFESTSLRPASRGHGSARRGEPGPAFQPRHSAAFGSAARQPPT